MHLAYVSIRQHTSAYGSIRQQIRQHTSAYVSIRQHMSAYLNKKVWDFRLFKTRFRLLKTSGDHRHSFEVDRDTNNHSRVFTGVTTGIAASRILGPSDVKLTQQHSARKARKGTGVEVVPADSCLRQKVGKRPVVGAVDNFLSDGRAHCSSVLSLGRPPLASCTLLLSIAFAFPWVQDLSFCKSTSSSHSLLRALDGRG
jgi:hypothetical protein